MKKFLVFILAISLVFSTSTICFADDEDYEVYILKSDHSEDYIQSGDTAQYVSVDDVKATIDIGKLKEDHLEDMAGHGTDGDYIVNTNKNEKNVAQYVKNEEEVKEAAKRALEDAGYKIVEGKENEIYCHEINTSKHLDLAVNVHNLLYSVIYRFNDGGTLDLEYGDIEYGANTQDKAPTPKKPVKEGFKFVKWTLYSFGGENVYENNLGIQDYVYDNTIYVAEWAKIIPLPNDEIEDPPIEEEEPANNNEEKQEITDANTDYNHCDCTVEKESTPEDTRDYSPQTGDETGSLWIPWMILIVTAGLLIYSLKRRK